jgi:hypothetical protein
MLLGLRGQVAGSDAIFVTGVASGQLDEAGEHILLSFDSATGPVRLVVPAAELAALLSVCIGLAGQGLPACGGREHATIPVADWRVGVTASSALVLGLAPEAGGALAFHLTPQQAREMAVALSRGVQLAEAGDPPAQAAHGSH